MTAPRRPQLFSVRVWLEDRGDGQSEWRGKVQHVLSGEGRYFRKWHTLVAFIIEKAAAESGRPEKERKQDRKEDPCGPGVSSES